MPSSKNIALAKILIQVALQELCICFQVLCFIFKAMIRILKHLEMNFIVVVHTHDVYGNETSKEFMSEAIANGICIHHSGTVTENKILDTFNVVADKSVTVVYFGDVDDAVSLLTNLQSSRRPSSSKINWMFTATLAERKEIVEQLSSEDKIICVACDGLINSVVVLHSNLINSSLQIHDIARGVSDELLNIAKPMMDVMLALAEGTKTSLKTVCGDFNLTQCSNTATQFHPILLQTLKSIALNISSKFSDLEFYPYEDKSISFDETGIQIIKETELQVHQKTGNSIQVVTFFV